MPSKYTFRTIENRGTSSRQASPFVEAEPLVFPSATPQTDLNGSGSWHETEVDNLGQQLTSLEREHDQDKEPETYSRQLCHTLVDTMPKEGIDEMLETLQEMHEFYDLRATQPVLHPPPQPKPIPVKLGRTIIRPEFPIVIDDEEE